MRKAEETVRSMFEKSMGFDKADRIPGTYLYINRNSPEPDYSDVHRATVHRATVNRNSSEPFYDTFKPDTFKPDSFEESIAMPH